VRRSHEAGAECHQVTKGVFFKILGLGYETSERVLAIVRRPSWPDAADLLKGNACALIGERIQDPRNVGVLVRTADAFSLPCVVFSADSADAYSRAAVRSTTGSIFRVPLTVAASLPEYLRRLKSRSIRLIGTSANADAPCAEADMSGPCAILLGNESEGLSREARKLCDVVVSIPMSGGAHSFNVTVAAGIALYERQRQNRSS